MAGIYQQQTYGTSSHYRSTRVQNPIQKCSLSFSITLLTTLALFIIAATAAAGKFPTPKLGWTVIGLGSALLISDLIVASESENKRDAFLALVIGVAYITLGALGGAGIINGRQVGQGILGTMGAVLLLSVCCCPRQQG